MMVLRVLLLVVLPGTTMGWSANSAMYNYPRSSSASYSSSWSNSNSNNMNGGGVSIYPPSSFRYSKQTPSVNYYYQEDDNNYSVGPRYQYTRSNNNNYKQQSLNRYDRFSTASSDYYNTNNNDNYYYNNNNAQDKPQVYPTSRYSVGGRTSSSYRLGYGGEYEDRDAYAPRRGSIVGSGRGRQEQRYGDAANGWSSSSYGSSSSSMQRYSAPRRRSNIQDKYYGDEYYALSPDNVDSVTGLGKRASYSNNERPSSSSYDSYYPSNNNMVRYQSPDTQRSNYNSMNQYNNFPSTKQPTRRLSSSSSSSYPSFVPSRGYNENSYYSSASNNQDSYYYNSNNNYSNSNSRYTQPSLQRSW